MTKAEQEGKAAYMAGLSIDANPYALLPESTAWFDWATGWHMARSSHEAQQKRPVNVLRENF